MAKRKSIFRVRGFDGTWNLRQNLLTYCGEHGISSDFDDQETALSVAKMFATKHPPQTDRGYRDGMSAYILVEENTPRGDTYKIARWIPVVNPSGGYAWQID